MAETYIISIDQSTQGTKALLFDEEGTLIQRRDLAHRQIINEKGWVSHDPEEIYHNTLRVVKELVENAGIDRSLVAGIGISNQRETTLIWEKESREPIADAVVWQCSRASEICEQEKIRGAAEKIKERTGLLLSPYFPAAKLAWLLKYVPGAEEMAKEHRLCFGTIDTWLLYRLTKGRSYKTDYSNASRTQLFDIFCLQWDEEICALFGINKDDLPQVCDSDSEFGWTDFEGFFARPVPIRAVLGDSHGALFGQGCLEKGDVKATYGTGSSIMMNAGEQPVRSTYGVVTSLAWRMQGKVSYVLEGNINYTGAVISWLKDDVKLIASPGESTALCEEAKKDDTLYFVPAFTGLGAPYWNSHAQASLTGITRTTGRAEIVRAGVECIAYQITDVVRAMEKDAQIPVKKLRVDGGPTRNQYLMQFQSDILGASVLVPNAEELSGIGAAYAAGIALGIYSTDIFKKMRRVVYEPEMGADVRERKYQGWLDAIKLTTQS
ncbi:MAG: glycerol kinase [Eubacteriales bacterium]|nr:glycerol kinase [Eubacteriales bacterium]